MKTKTNKKIAKDFSVLFRLTIVFDAYKNFIGITLLTMDSVTKQLYRNIMYKFGK